MTISALDVQFSSHTPAPDAGYVNAKVRVSGTNPTYASFEVPAPGSGGSSPAVVFKVNLAPGAAGNFTVAHGANAVPSFVLIQMTSGSAIWLQTPTSFDSSNLYLVSADPSATGYALVFTSVPDATIAFTTSAGGNFNVAHGLGVTPAIAFVELTSSGAVWFQTPPADSTNIKLVASDTGLTGKVIVFKVVPVFVVLAFVEVSLAPGVSGNFTVSHGLGEQPIAVIIRMTSGGAIWLQTPTGYDATNIYLTASDPAVTGFADVWGGV